MELSCLTVGPCWTAEAIKPAGANGKGEVEFAGVFCVVLFLLASMETCPVPLGLAPWNWKASWLR